MSEVMTPSADLTPPATTSVRRSAELLDRVATGVIVLAVIAGVCSIFGGLVAIVGTDGASTHPNLGLGLAWVVGGGMLAFTVTMLAVWAKTYAAVVKHTTAD